MSGIPAFTPLPFHVATSDGRNFTLLDDVFYTSADGTKYRLPAGDGTSDGASTPAAVWAAIPPFGQYWPAAFLHDCAYRDTLEIWDGVTWDRATLPKDKCDALLFEAMLALGVGEFEAKVIYEAVVLAGQNSFDKDRQK
jgi:hypothetical protein